MSNLILASSSPYRRSLLERLGLPFSSIAPDLDERRLPAEPARDLVQRLAEAKARAVARPDSLVIGSDQAAVLEDQVLGKPGGPQRARHQLRTLRGRAVLFLTAVTLLDTGAEQIRHHVDETRVVFRPLTDEEIDGYLAAEQPYDCAGAFKVEGLGISLFDRVESTDPTALIGLPLIWLSQALTAAGCSPLTASS